METQPLVVIESPYAGDIERNAAYARRCLLHSIRKGEAPVASHLLYPQVLSESGERDLGIELGYAWLAAADMQIFYIDLGWSNGMKLAREVGRRMDIQSEVRCLGVSSDV